MDLVTNRVEVKIGTSSSKGLDLLKTILGNRQVQQSLKGLNVRLDNDTLESLAYILAQYTPGAEQLKYLQFFSYQPLPPAVCYPRKTALDGFIVPAELIHPYDVFVRLKLSPSVTYRTIRQSPVPEDDADYERNKAKVGTVVQINGKLYFETRSATPSVLARSYFPDCK